MPRQPEATIPVRNLLETFGVSVVLEYENSADFYWLTERTGGEAAYRVAGSAAEHHSILTFAIQDGRFFDERI